MAWYRAGGGGIPSSLKTGMNSVLNKKFGTSTTYDPAGWPDNINLMGPLPEKTVSGAIATFADGADGVPLKKCEITLPASLSGVSSVTETQTGRNLLDVSTAQGTGTIWFYYDNGIKLKKGVTYTFSCGNYGNGSIAFYGTDHSTQIAYAYISASSAQVTYTPTEDVIVCPRIYQSGLTVSGLVDVMLEYGSTAHAYEPYQTPTVYTASLGRTIYGGTADVVKGQGASTHNIVDLGSLTWTKRNTSSGHWRFTTQDVPVVINDDASHVPSMVCTEYTAISPTQSWNGVKGISCNIVISQLIVCDESYETASDFKTSVSGVYLVYPLATPETFTFDPVPIDSKLGNNTLWSEQGSDTEVTYRADINLALGGQ